MQHCWGHNFKKITKTFFTIPYSGYFCLFDNPPFRVSKLKGFQGYNKLVHLAPSFCSKDFFGVIRDLGECNGAERN